MMEKPTLIGPNLVLRPITEADASAMFNSAADPENRRLTGTQITFSLEDVEQFCRRIQTADDRFDFAITLKGDPQYIGEAVLNNIDWHNRSAGFRIALAGKAHFGKGYGSEATRLVVDFGLKTLKLHRIELEVYDFNPRAQHVYEKAGFQVEGIRRDALHWEGQYHNAIMMAILQADAS